MTTQTRTLLGCGIVAGPIYVAAGLAQALTRDGFQLDRHAWSLLSNGGPGWIQIANFLLAGLLTIAAAAGLRRVLPGGRWAPILTGVYGASLIGAGIFRADPAQGFPVGTPEVTPVSWHGTVHFACGGVGFLSLIVACLLIGGQFARADRAGLAWFSRIAGVGFLAAFAGIASGSHGPTTLAFVAAVIIVWAWLTTICTHYATEATDTHDAPRSPQAVDTHDAPRRR